MNNLTREVVEIRLKDSFGIDPNILKHYDEPHRYYHNFDHIMDLLNLMIEDGGWSDDKLFLAILFHDIIYNPMSTGGMNEKLSCDIFASVFTGSESTLAEIRQAILGTVDHVAKYINGIGKKLVEYDLQVVNGTFGELMEWEHKIFKEYQFVPLTTYKRERINVIQNLMDKHYVENRENLEYLIDYVNNRKPNIGIYAGTFGPFHKGHYNVLKKAEQIFDKVIIFKGKNPSKENQRYFRFPDSLRFYEKAEQSGLLTDYINSLGFDVTLIRGLRNTTDLQFEINQSRYLESLKPDIKIVSIFCDPEFQHISSSDIRSLMKLKYTEAQKYLLSDTPFFKYEPKV